MRINYRGLVDQAISNGANNPGDITGYIATHTTLSSPTEIADVYLYLSGNWNLTSQALERQDTRYSQRSLPYNSTEDIAVPQEINDLLIDAQFHGCTEKQIESYGWWLKGYSTRCIAARVGNRSHNAVRMKLKRVFRRLKNT